MSLRKIRSFYELPKAKKGAKVRLRSGNEGIILGASMMLRLKVVLPKRRDMVVLVDPRAVEYL